MKLTEIKTQSELLEKFAGQIGNFKNGNLPNDNIFKDYVEYSDIELINFFVENEDELAFNEIFNRYYHKVRNISLKMLKDIDEAEELTQEVFIKLLTTAHSFRGESKFSTWLYAVTTNTIRMRFRKLKKSRKSISIDDENYNESLNLTISKENNRQGNPETISINHELAERLYEALEDLPEKSREVMLLRAREEYTNSEISKELGVSLPAIKSKVFRARQNLKENLNFAEVI